MEMLLGAILVILLYIAFKINKIQGQTYWILEWIEKHLGVGKHSE